MDTDLLILIIIPALLVMACLFNQDKEDRKKKSDSSQMTFIIGGLIAVLFILFVTNCQEEEEEENYRHRPLGYVRPYEKNAYYRLNTAYNSPVKYVERGAYHKPLQLLNSSFVPHLPRTRYDMMFDQDYEDQRMRMRKVFSNMNKTCS